MSAPVMGDMRARLVMKAVPDEPPIELLQAMPVFGGIGTDSLRFLLSIAPVREVKRDQYFYREGDAADSMFVLLSGRAMMLKSWRGRTTGSGRWCGETTSAK